MIVDWVGTILHKSHFLPRFGPLAEQGPQAEGVVWWLGDFTTALTRESLRFLGLRNATSGGSGQRAFILGLRCRVGKNCLTILVMLGRPG